MTFFFSCFGLGAIEFYQNQCEHVVNNSLIDLSSNNKTIATTIGTIIDYCMVSLSPFAALVCLLAPSLLDSKTTSLGEDDHVFPSHVTIEYFHFIDEETETKEEKFNRQQDVKGRA